MLLHWWWQIWDTSETWTHTEHITWVCTSLNTPWVCQDCWMKSSFSFRTSSDFVSFFISCSREIKKSYVFFSLRIRIINDRKLQSQWVYQSLSFQFVDFVVQLPPFLFHSWDVATLTTTTTTKTKMFPSLFWYFWHAVVILTKQTKCERRI